MRHDTSTSQRRPLGSSVCILNRGCLLTRLEGSLDSHEDAAQAARETTTLVETSVSRAQEGTGVAQGFGQTLAGIVSQVSRASELVSAIHRASDEQAEGVQQITAAVAQVDQVTQSIAASSEESAAAVEELSAQASAVANTAGDLARLVGVEVHNAHCGQAAETVRANIAQRRADLSSTKRR